MIPCWILCSNRATNELSSLLEIDLRRDEFDG